MPPNGWASAARDRARCSAGQWLLNFGYFAGRLHAVLGALFDLNSNLMSRSNALKILCNVEIVLLARSLSASINAIQFLDKPERLASSPCDQPRLARRDMITAASSLGFM